MSGRRKIAPLNIRLTDDDAERVRLNFEERIAALEALSSSDLQIIANVEIGDGETKRVPHGLGRKPRFVWCSTPRVRGGVVSPGVIEEVQEGATDRTSAVMLKASDFGGSIFVDVAVL